MGIEQYVYIMLQVKKKSKMIIEKNRCLLVRRNINVEDRDQNTCLNVYSNILDRNGLQYTVN